MRIILKIALRLPPKYRRFFKRRFPQISDFLLTNSSSLIKWQNKQVKFENGFDLEADRLQVQDALGSSSLTQSIIIVSPLYPTKSGIANYTSKLADELKDISKISLIPSILEGGNFQLQPGVRANLPRQLEVNSQSEILYMLGNGHHHWKTWSWILEHPGYVLVHDAKIPDIPLMFGEDSSWYDLGYDEKSSKYFGRVPVHTKGIITHSDHAAEVVRSQLSSLQLGKIPIHVLSTGHPVERRLLLSKSFSEYPTIGTFGFQTANKNPVLTYSVIAYLAKQTDGRGLICGEIDEYHVNLATKIWLNYGNDAANLNIRSWVEEKEYDKLMSTVDVGVQLRNRSNGESSGPLTQLTARGVPTVVTDIGTFSSFPNMPGVLKIPEKTPLADIPFHLKPLLQLTGDSERYLCASRELQQFYLRKTYRECAEEIFNT
jgi:hypothetical protein